MKLQIIKLSLTLGLIVMTVNRPAIKGQSPGAQKAEGRAMETLTLTSKVFNNTRTLRVLPPPDYHAPQNSAKRYPVLYLNDGIMVFNPNRIGIEAVAAGLYQAGKLPPMIIVGLDNGGSTNRSANPGRDRDNEYLPYPDVGFPGNTYDPNPPDPQGKLYPDFLIKEVMPLINERYRTKTGRANTGLGGFSYGGVIALYTVLAHPDHFGKLLLESTPLWIGRDYQLLKDAQQAKRWPAAIHLGGGGKEADIEAINREGTKLEEQLQKIIREKSPETRLNVVREADGKHDAADWRRRLPGALEFLFKN